MSVMESVGIPRNKPMIATVFGEAGLGKTSLAAAFPKPIFIRAEDGVNSIPAKSRPQAFPVLQDVPTLWEQLNGLINEQHDFKTLVIDSISKLESMFIEHVVSSDPKKPATIRQAVGGYGAGLDAVGAMHRRVRKAAGILRDKKGMHVVFIGHAETDTVSPPDGESYSKYSLRMNQNKSTPPYTDDVDLVGFVRLQMFMRGSDDERKLAVTDGSRALVCHATASNISKNRLGITEEIPFALGENPLAPYLENGAKK